ncbi:MAG: hypothetical protein WCY06_06540 [Flavobacteriaceae bacterium]
MNHTDLIEKYIQNKVTTEELAEVKRLIVEDVEFKDELSFQLELQEAVKREERQQLKQCLKNLEQKKKNNSLFPILWKVAAVFVIGLGIFWFFNQPTDFEKLYAKNFEPYPNIVAPTVRNTTENEIQQAFNNYDTHNYKKAAIGFKTLYDKNKSDYANFYYAISLMADNQIEQAIEALENPNWEIPEKYQIQTDWYLALGYLKLENVEKAKSYLKKVVTTEDIKSRQAQKLLSEIE